MIWAKSAVAPNASSTASTYAFSPSVLICGRSSTRPRISSMKSSAVRPPHGPTTT